ncbi:MAG: glycoside hydrolase family 31 protein [Eubacteriales bacterium]|nr:glycoside hydrolase family 31 protein [Eubacteriales bacterium]
MGMENYQLESHPLCHPESVLQGEHYRITILTPALIRLEYAEDGVFEDRATQSVLNRDFPPCSFRVDDTPEELSVYTDALELHYNRKPFAPNGLCIKVSGGIASEGTWHYGEEPRDLRGTARTLDEANGPIPLGHGLISRNGFSVVDDSRSMALTDDGWVAPRKQGIADLYFFGYGHRYLDCLNDFYYLCGKTPLLPRYALGNWWSRYHRYTETEYKELIERFEAEHVPFSVAVVDMDWHLVDDVDPKYGSGWTGYTWNRKFFPDPKAFMAWLHEHGMKITLNVHPADGVRAYEDLYPRVAKAMGMNPEDGLPVQFDATNPEFMEIYFKELHHPLEEEGVDFWWLDWQQGTATKIPGLDPLWMLNHYHFLDSRWKGTRPMTFSRYAGVGSHRYPVGFSGDTVITWDSLQFQPYFTSTASNVGYGWWSHDIGGHMMGVRDDELMARWVQLGVFSPINRLHSSENPFNGKEPWKYDKITESVMKEYLSLRHALVPYLYTMNRRASRENIPLILPMYYLEPEQAETYEVPNEYYFGSELIVSPITEPQDRIARAGKAQAWLPKGLWADFFTGMIYHGDRLLELWRGVEQLPVLMKAGAIVPMKDMSTFDNSIENPQAMEVRIFPAEDGAFTLWEDAGDTPTDADENWAATELAWNQETSSFHISPAQGNVSVLPKTRSWKLAFIGITESPCQVTIDGAEAAFACSYQKETAAQILTITDVPVGKEIRVTYPNGLSLAAETLNARCYKLLEKAQIEYNLKSRVMSVIEKQGASAVATLAAMHLNPAVFGELCEILQA